MDVPSKPFSAPAQLHTDVSQSYYDEIKNPMDFKTMKSKLHSKNYQTMEQFAEDVQLIVRNAHQFNPRGTLPWLAAEELGKAFEKEWAKVMENEKPGLTAAERSGLKTLMNQLLKEDV